MTVIALLLAFVGWTCLSLSMHRHQRQLGFPPDASSYRSIFRWVGAFMIAASLWASADAWGPEQGPVAWFGVLTGSAFLLVLLLSMTSREDERRQRGAPSARR